MLWPECSQHGLKTMGKQTPYRILHNAQAGNRNAHCSARTLLHGREGDAWGMMKKKFL